VTAGLGSGRRVRALWERRSSPRARHDAQDGFTLVEILISVWIMGGVMVALMGALFSLSRASDLQRKTSLAETELRHYVEQTMATPYVPCAGESGYGTYPAYAPSDSSYSTIATGSLAVNGFWYSAAGDPSANFGSVAFYNGWFTPKICVPANKNDTGAQKLTLTVTVSDPGGSGTSVTKSQTIVKRDDGLHP
jgi:prepilin-type N-terminal cleavage/methylation domain-containing protein